jgi:hypothetical protein
VIGIPVIGLKVLWRVIPGLGPGFKQLYERIAEGMTDLADVTVNLSDLHVRKLSEISEDGPGKIFVGNVQKR